MSTFPNTEKRECNENAMHSGVLFAALTLKVFGDVIKQVFQERSKRLVRNRLIGMTPVASWSVCSTQEQVDWV